MEDHRLRRDGARGLSRRLAVGRLGTGALAALGLALSPHPAAAGKTANPNGIAGGGLVRWEGGEANLTLYTVRLREGEDVDHLVVLFLAGQVAWVDAGWEGTGLRLESTAIEGYGPVAGQEETAREIRGRMMVNGAGEEPFLLRAVDGGALGAGQDTVALAVGNRVEGEEAGTSDFGYQAEGVLATGGLQRIQYEFTLPDDCLLPGTPTG